MILVIKHIAIEGPGTIGEFFNNSDWSVKIVEVDRGVKLPEELSEIEAVIVLGGPMNVYEEDKYHFLKDEGVFLKRIIEKDIPVLGICLGAQLLAKVCNAQIKKAKKEEIGWYRVNLTEDGKNDSLFESIETDFDVFQWHEDTFDIPNGARLLATSATCKNQAFRIGENTYGLQFHIEVTDGMIKDWIDEYARSCDIKLQMKAMQMFVDYYMIREKFDRFANRIYLNFSKIIANGVKV